MTVTTSATVPDVFVDLVDAVMRTSESFHRLEHLGRRSIGRRRTFTFEEEAITGLLLAEMVGSDFVVDGQCPVPVPAGSCLEWTALPIAGRRNLRVHALSKFEEGGRPKSGQDPVGADFVIVVDEPVPPDTPKRQFRMLIQAKRCRPGQAVIRTRKDRDQYVDLLAAAAALDAVPYYLFYVQQPDAHLSSNTRCTMHVRAADRAMVLVPAGAPASPSSYLPGKMAEEVLELGRPLRCLGGCGSPRTAQTAWAAVTTFITSDFPDHRPSEPREAPKGLAQVGVDESVIKIRPRRDRSPSIGQGVAPGRHDLVVVRLGGRRHLQKDGRVTGYSTGLEDWPEELRETARRYWRIAPREAEGLGYLVVVGDGRPLEAYEIRPDGVTYTLSPNRLRVATFDIEAIDGDASPDERSQLLRAAQEAVSRLRPGAQNPVLYVRDPLGERRVSGDEE